MAFFSAHVCWRHFLPPAPHHTLPVSLSEAEDEEEEGEPGTLAPEVGNWKKHCSPGEGENGSAFTYLTGPRTVSNGDAVSGRAAIRPSVFFFLFASFYPSTTLGRLH